MEVAFKRDFCLVLVAGTWFFKFYNTVTEIVAKIQKKVTVIIAELLKKKGTSTDSHKDSCGVKEKFAH